MTVRLRGLATLAAVSLTAIGAGRAVNSFLPRRFATWYEPQETFVYRDPASFPNVEVSFLRCGSVSVPESILASSLGSCERCTRYSRCSSTHRPPSLCS